jgi:hypothetical protein
VGQTGCVNVSAGDLSWPALWAAVAGRLRAHRAAGRTHLLTEDTLRLETVLALQEAGVDPGRLTAEYLAPQLSGGKIDLALDAPTGVLIEFKYPRGSRTGISPDTMTLGELVRDFVRLAALPAEERWVVQLIGPRLARYLDHVRHRHPVEWVTTVGQDFVLTHTSLAALPATAAKAIGPIVIGTAIRARCTAAEAVDDGLTLYAYVVQSAGSERQAVAPAAPLSTPTPTPTPTEARATGARGEILDAITAVTTRSGRPNFTIAEIADEMRRRGSRYADSTISTMISSHLRADAQGPGIDSHTDLERVDRGVYRLRKP